MPRFVKRPRDTISLGAVLAEREVDPHTHLLLIRADVDAAAGGELEHRLVALRLAGATTLIVDVGCVNRVSGAIIVTLSRARRKLESRNGRLLITAECPEARHVLECAGLDVIDLDAEAAGVAWTDARRKMTA